MRFPTSPESPRPAAGQIVAGQFRLERKLGEGLSEGPERVEALVSASNRGRWMEEHGIIDQTPLSAYVPT